MWQIARKEILLNLLSLRFALGTAIVVCMMGIVGHVLVEDFAARQQAYITDVQRHEEALAETKVFSRLSVTVDFPPSPLSMFSRGVQDLPSSVTVSAYHVPSLLDAGGAASIDIWGKSKRTYNPLLKVFSFIDLAFVIRVVLSLFALLLVFDSLSGERERGTLPMVMACPVRRLEMVAGKFLGALVTVAVPLAVGFLVVILLWGLADAVRISASVWVGTGFIYALSLVFLAGFLGLGMWLSLRAWSSSSVLMVLLLVWVLMAVIIPEGIGYLAKYAQPRRARQSMVGAVEDHRTRLEKQYWNLKKEYPQKHGWWGRNGSGFSGGGTLLGTTREEVYNLMAFNERAFPLKFQYAEERYRLTEPYARALHRWSQLRKDFQRTSMCSVYENLVRTVAGTDLGSYDEVLVQAREFRELLLEYLQPKIREAAWFTRLLEHPEMETTPENTARWRRRQEAEGNNVLWTDILTWDKIDPLNLEAMPRPYLRHPGLTQRLEHASIDLLLLFAFTTVAHFLIGWQALRIRIL